MADDIELLRVKLQFAQEQVTCYEQQYTADRALLEHGARHFLTQALHTNSLALLAHVRETVMLLEAQVEAAEGQQRQPSVMMRRKA